MAKIQVGDVLKSIDGNSIDIDNKKALSEGFNFRQQIKLFKK